MKRLIAMIFAVVIIASLFSGCGTTRAPEEVPSYDQILLDMGESAIDQFPVMRGRTFTVERRQDGIYSVDLNGSNNLIKLPDKDHHKVLPVNTETVTQRKYLKIVEASQSYIVDYIEKSDILKDKDYLIEKITTVPVVFADEDELGDGAAAMYQDGVVYLFRDYQKYICEWMVTHELVHYLCELTNDGLEKTPYPYNLFNEAMTDIITSTMNPKLHRGAISGYSELYPKCLEYIGCFGEEAIEAYFYGYDSIWEKTGRVEFDFFVTSFENMMANELAFVCVNNALNEWHIEHVL